MGLGDGVGITEGFGVGEMVGYPVGALVGLRVSNISQVSKLDDIAMKKLKLSEYVPSRNKDHSYAPVALTPTGYSENNGY